MPLWFVLGFLCTLVALGWVRHSPGCSLAPMLCARDSSAVISSRLLLLAASLFTVWVSLLCHCSSSGVSLEDEGGGVILSGSWRNQGRVILLDQPGDGEGTLP